MALTRCPDCRKQVSDQAPACPHCGRPKSATTSATEKKKESTASTVLGVIVLTVVIGGVVSMCSSGDDAPSSASKAASAATSPPPEAVGPAVLQSAKALDEKYEITANSHCNVEADDYLRSIAKYDFKWDDTGFLDSKFTKYLANVVAPGVLTVVSDKAKLQNGFGAFQHIELFCDYDTQSQRVVRFRFIGPPGGG